MPSTGINTIEDSDRYPTITESGKAMLRFMREHPNAPRFKNTSGNRLTEDDIAFLRAREKVVEDARAGWPLGGSPQWLDEFVSNCIESVPFYKRYGFPGRLEDLPTISRGDLGRDIAAFVPDNAPIERLVNYRTSGTSGHPLLIASHPRVAASYLLYHKRALRRFGVELTNGKGQVGVLLIGWQQECFTYVSVTPLMGESGLAKINLHPDDWNDPDDRGKYIDALRPEVIAGDPLSFEVLSSLQFQHKPRALFSTSMTLLTGMRTALESRFECPVLDLYSMNEAGPIAVYDDEAGGHALLQERLYIEVLDDDGNRLPDGERGEITLTGGFNSCLPLLRYRTGDQASIARNGDDILLIGLEGRPPVLFRTIRGEWINNIEVTHALRKFSLSRFSLRQESDGSLTLRLPGGHPSSREIEACLEGVFGAGQRIHIDMIPDEGKVVQYSSSLSR